MVHVLLYFRILIAIKQRFKVTTNELSWESSKCKVDRLVITYTKNTKDSS